VADYLKIPELARRLDVSEKTARRYVKAGVLPSTFIGGAYRVTEVDLEAFLRGAEVKPGGEVHPKAPPDLDAADLEDWASEVDTLDELRPVHRACGCSGASSRTTTASFAGASGR
jgi:excisionase family DNA binding protein